MSKSVKLSYKKIMNYSADFPLETTWSIASLNSKHSCEDADKEAQLE